MITLPPNFEADIQGQNLNLYPVVLIGTYVMTTPPGNETASDFGGQLRADYHFYPNGTYNNNQNPGILPRINGHTMIFSTRADSVKYNIDSNMNHPVAVKPLLLNIPSIKESMDFENRKYKISNVTLKFSNYEYEGERFSDYAGNLINKEVRILWFSQSTEGWSILPQTASGYALHVYKGFIRRYSHDEQCTLQLEDSTQKDLHKDVPVARLGQYGEEVLSKYKLKPYPMVYGHVDRSPCVVDKNPDDSGDNRILSDYIEKYDVEIIADLIDTTNPIKIFKDDVEVYVLKDSINYNRWGYNLGLQYTFTEGDGYAIFKSPFTHTNTSENDDFSSGSPLLDNTAEVGMISSPIDHKLFIYDDNVEGWLIGGMTYAYYQYNATEIDEQINILKGFIPNMPDQSHDGAMTVKLYKLAYNYKTPPDAFIDDFYSVIKYDIGLTLTDFTQLPSTNPGFWGYELNIGLPQGAASVNTSYNSIFSHLSSEYNGDISDYTNSSLSDIWIPSSPLGFESGWSEYPLSSFEFKNNMVADNVSGAYRGVHCQQEFTINSEPLLFVNFLIKDFIESDFYANVQGRKSP